MDWDLPILKEITIKVRFMAGEKYLFDAITWAGFVGIFTGIKSGNYTISLNYRRNNSPNFLENFISVFKGYYPHSFFIRSLLSSDDDPMIVKSVKLISPAYYIILKDDIKCTIIRDREKVLNIKEAPCVQTNCDEIDGKRSGDNIMLSYERLDYMEKIIDKTYSKEKLIKYINQHPIVNGHTIYTTIMSIDGFVDYNV